MTKLELVIRNSNDVKNLRRRIDGLKLQLLEFQAITIRKQANVIIVDTIHKRMREANFSEKIVVNTILSNIEFISKTKIRLHFISTLFTDTGFDIALAREKGTKAHDVYPKKPTLDRPNPSLKLIINGKVSFYKHTHPSGIKALHIIEKTIKELGDTLQKKYNQDLAHWISGNLKGVDINAV